GLKVLNVRDQEFGDETRANFRFNGVTTYNGFIYAATDEGIYRIQEEGSNIQDFNAWELLDESFGFPMDYSVRSITTYNGSIYLAIDDVLHQYRPEDGTMEPIYSEERHEIRFLTAEGEHLIVGAYCLTESGSSCNGEVLFFDPEHDVQSFGSGCVNRPRYAIEDQNGRVYYADAWDEYRIAESTTEFCDKSKYVINSPFSHTIGEIFIDEDGSLVIASEVVPPFNNFSSAGLFMFKDNTWSVYNNRSNPELNGNRAFYRVAVHPETKKIYIGTRWDGLLEFDGEKMVTYNRDNSLLLPSADPNRVRVNGLVFDQDNNLWMSNHTAERPICVLKNDGTFTNSFLPIPIKELRQMVIDLNGFIWIATDENGVYVYDANGTIDDPSDDRLQWINAQNSLLPSDRVNCLAVDLDGNVWVGTQEGTLVYECQESIFDSNCQGTRRIVTVDGISAFLLETENIRTIAVDGANRKWFGTNNGVFVQSPSGAEQIAAFDVNNSPLFDNIISDIEINNETGEVFIGTGKGLISVKTDALGGGIVHKSNVYAYPNPVRPDYDGPIAIKGFARDSNIKITDINGQLIFETTALGGQAIWDGRDYNGRKASTGVYLVLGTRTSNRDNPEAVVTKILFVN
ncbi:MAG: two-component regulator propeller domain-containing protein, partial [Bacteroidota bacterium]